ncbi:MAG: hypothetical protein U9R29_08480 [Thermodesulfobacteriota bacterium]|nr:hypothetical protein [Thermodesulfobacteriota bacterium]
MKQFSTILMIFVFLLLLSVAAMAEPTQVTVRAKAHDAKFIGTAMGGLNVSLTDVHSGEVCAQGIILGGTGSTDTLMKNPIQRGQSISNSKTAAFVATVDIEEPTQIEVRVYGPHAGGSTAVNSTRTFWLLPGQHVLGDGIVFELYGFVVVPLTPYANTKVKPGETIDLSAYVTMLCGCSVKPDGIWDANRYQVFAWIWKENQLVEKISMQIESVSGLYKATFTPSATGSYRIAFCAADSSSNNYGVAYSGIAVK